MANEVWKVIDEYNGYSVSHLGKVKNNKTGRILKPAVHNGYNRVVLSCNGIAITKKVSRLVAIMFLDNPLGLGIVNHKNRNRLDDRAVNLEWTSQRENACHAKRKNKIHSQYTGVSSNISKRSPWRATIYFNGKFKTIGKFKTELEAFNARVEFEVENGITNKYLHSNDTNRTKNT